MFRFPPVSVMMIWVDDTSKRAEQGTNLVTTKTSIFTYECDENRQPKKRLEEPKILFKGRKNNMVECEASIYFKFRSIKNLD